MSYLDYPRIHFSGKFKASPSTINNTPNNYDPSIYPTPDELQKVELYWNPKGNGGFGLVDCTVQRVEYGPNDVATAPEQDALIGQPVTAIRNPAFPLEAALVDLDPMQQNVSEIWGLKFQVGGSDASFTGSFMPVPFNAIWGQCQGPTAPHSSASGSAVFQAQLQDLSVAGDTSKSRFLKHIKGAPSETVSVNLNTNAHNNSPPIYRFSADTFAEMLAGGVPQAVLDKIEPMQHLFQNVDREHPDEPLNPGDVPTEDFATFMLQQYLTLEEYNGNIDTILEKTTTPYAGSTEYDFNYGMITGTMGVCAKSDPALFVRSRMLYPPAGSPAYFAPFTIDRDNLITLNLGNSLPTVTPGSAIYTKKLGSLTLVYFDGDVSLSNAKPLAEIPYTDPDFLTARAGFFSYRAGKLDLSQTPLGIISQPDGGAKQVILQERADGLFCRADRFVYRMNPGIPTTPDYSRGETSTVHIHALRFGQPVSDGTVISMKMKSPEQAVSYTSQTPGTSGTEGIKNLSVPQDRLAYPASAKIVDGVATFELCAKAPGNPRKYVDGQIYFLDYNFEQLPVSDDPAKDPNDIVSVQVYNAVTEAAGADVLDKFGRLYKIMSFLADGDQIEQIDLRNMIKILLQKPMTDVVHMPVTRDLSASARKQVIEWIDTLNRS